jgi:hypothetical protein
VWGTLSTQTFRYTAAEEQAELARRAAEAAVEEMYRKAEQESEVEDIVRFTLYLGGSLAVVAQRLDTSVLSRLLAMGTYVPWRVVELCT